MRIIKWIKKCPVFLLLVISGLALTLIGAAGRFSIYKDYKFDPIKRPFLALVMEGAGNGTAPWEIAEHIGMGAGEFPGRLFAVFQTGDEGQSIDDIEGKKAEEAASLSFDLEEETLPEDPAMDENSDPEANETEEETDSLIKSEFPDETGEDLPGGTEAGKTYEFQTVAEDYFDDAAFIGDSRTVGLFEYGGLEERADFYAKISLTIYNVFSELLAKEEGTGKKITAEEALSQKQYGKVYLMLGINELGTGTTETFMEEYKAVVERIRELQPDAVIFVEGIMKVTASKDAEDPIFNNKNIEEKNAAIAELADNQTIFYIDVNEAVCDAEGNLNAEYTIDEVHLKAKYYEIWKQFLLEHGIER